MKNHKAAEKNGLDYFFLFHDCHSTPSELLDIGVLEEGDFGDVCTIGNNRARKKKQRKNLILLLNFLSKNAIIRSYLN